MASHCVDRRRRVRLQHIDALVDGKWYIRCRCALILTHERLGENCLFQSGKSSTAAQLGDVRVSRTPVMTVRNRHPPFSPRPYIRH